MAPKLSDSDKNTIVELYQHPDESTATLASRYGVSSSTISRILKQALSEDQYREIVKQKKGGGSKPQPKSSKATGQKQRVEPAGPNDSDSNDQESTQDTEAIASTSEKTSSQANGKSDSSQPQKAATKSPPPIVSLQKQKDAASHSDDGPSESVNLSETVDSSAAAPSDNLQLSLSSPSPAPPILKKDASKSEQPDPQQNTLTSGWDDDDISSDLLDLDDLDEDDLDDDDLDDDLDNDDDTGSDDDDFSELEGEDADFAFSANMLSVLPFSEAKLPRTCYIIIDRSAELITRPLKAFSDLGEVPEADVDELTLPIFDNHRVAKRFVNRRTQRIVKVPDAQVLRKTSSYLMDKGITRLLLSGQVYSLMDDEDYEYEDAYD